MSKHIIICHIESVLVTVNDATAFKDLKVSGTKALSVVTIEHVLDNQSDRCYVVKYHTTVVQQQAQDSWSVLLCHFNSVLITGTLEMNHLPWPSSTIRR